MKGNCFLILTCVMAGCSNENEMELEALPGIYAAYYTDEYSERFDTLFIKPVSVGRSDLFMIEKHSSAFRVLDGVVMPPQRRYHQWEGAFDHPTGSILLEPGKPLYYDREKEEIRIGKQRFQKINQLP